jgi:DNA-binding LytR/AlgR family response regulator
MKLKAVIIEDESPSMERLIRQISDISADISIIAKIESVQEGLVKLPLVQPDVIISDIELGDGLSFDLFKKVNPTCPVIFITAFNQYAIESFKANAIDYLLKPASKEDIKKALLKVKSRTEQITPAIDYNALAEAILQREKQKDKRFLIKIGQKYVTVECSSIAFAYTEFKINYVVDKGGKQYPIDLTLEQLEGDLGPEKFFRINRSFIVGFDAISGIKQYSKGRVILQTNPPAKSDFLIVGADKSPLFKKWLEGKAN